MSAPRSISMMPRTAGLTRGQRLPRTLFAGFNGLGFDIPSPGDVLDAGKKAADQATQQAQQAEQQAQQRAGQVIQAAQGSIPDPATLIKSIKLDTTHLPPLEVIDPLKPTPPGVGSQVTRALKPRITVTFNPVFGQQVPPVVYAPYGDPGPSDWDTWAALGGLAIAAGVTVSALGLISTLKGHKNGLLHKLVAKIKARRAAKRGASLKGLRLPKSKLGKAALAYVGVGVTLGAVYEFKRWSNIRAAKAHPIMGQQVSDFKLDPLDFAKGVFMWPAALAMGAFH